ncbi:MAG TPA: RidA family protein [Planctomycetia bacterium]|nr:RidA family protein [Planctomycetia bacterium]
MGAEAKLVELKIQLPAAPAAKPYLNMASRVGDVFYASGHVSDMKGKVGGGLSVEDGKAAAREACIKMLASVRQAAGTLDHLRVVRVLGMVNSTPDFIEQHLVINGCSDLLHDIFGRDDLGYHARSAVGFVSLPTGVAVEIEGIFAIDRK